MTSAARAALAAALAAVLLAGAAEPARADGDPASDYLLTQQVFLPFDTKLAPALQQQLVGLVANANRAGYRIRVALIASDFDLGSVTALWRKPRAYAHFLGEELSFVYRDRLLVVMPNGFGFNDPHHTTASAYKLLAAISFPPGPSGLVQAGMTAVQRLAAADGVKVAASGQLAKPAQRNARDRIVLIAAIIGLLALGVLARLGLRRRGGGPRTASRRR